MPTCWGTTHLLAVSGWGWWSWQSLTCRDFPWSDGDSPLSSAFLLQLQFWAKNKTEKSLISFLPCCRALESLFRAPTIIARWKKYAPFSAPPSSISFLTFSLILPPLPTAFQPQQTGWAFRGGDRKAFWAPWAPVLLPQPSSRLLWVTVYFLPRCKFLETLFYLPLLNNAQ